MNLNYRNLNILPLFLASFLSLSCSNDSSHPLLIGTNVWPGYEPLYLARELGYLDNSKIKLLEYNSASQGIRNYRNNLINAAALTLDEVLLLNNSGIDTRVVLVMDISNGGDVIVSKSDIKSFEKLKGRKIGVEKSALGAYTLARALELNNLSLNDIQTVNIDVSQHESEFDKGNIDAVVTFDPVRSKLLAKGGNIVFDSTQIPGEIVDVLIVRGDYIDDNPEIVRNLIKAWFKALEYMNTKPEEAYRIMSSRMNLSLKETRDSYNGLVLPNININNSMLFDSSSPNNLLKTSEKLTKIMKSQNILNGNPDNKKLFYNLTKCCRIMNPK